MSEYSIAPRKKIIEYVEKSTFDGAVVILYDSHTGLCSNHWHFSGHPSNLGTRELSAIAQQLAAHTAEALKTDINDPSGRKVIVEKPRVIAMEKRPKEKDKNYKLLWGIGLAWNPIQERHLWLQFDWSLKQAGFTIYWGDGIGILIGPLYFCAYMG